MFQKILALLLLFSFSACASSNVARNGLVKPKPIVTPFEYYSKARPAVYLDQDKPTIQRAAAHNTGEDTKEDHHQAIIIGTLVGIAVIGGTVGTILAVK